MCGVFRCNIHYCSTASGGKTGVKHLTQGFLKTGVPIIEPLSSVTDGFLPLRTSAVASGLSHSQDRLRAFCEGSLQHAGPES